MRAIGMLCVMAGCISVGVWYRMLYIRKCRNLLAVQKGITILEGEISYGRTPLPDAFHEMAKRTGGCVSEFFEEISRRLSFGGEGMEAVWSSTLREIIGDCELGREEWRDLKELGNTLGYLDSRMQLQSLQLYQKRLAYSIGIWEKEKEKKTKLYPVLGTICGVLICLLLV